MNGVCVLQLVFSRPYCGVLGCALKYSDYESETQLNHNSRFQNGTQLVKVCLYGSQLTGTGSIGLLRLAPPAQKLQTVSPEYRFLCTFVCA